MVEKQNQSQQTTQIQIEIKQNPPAKRIEVHPIHQKLVVRDMKTGQYVNKR